MNPIKRIVIFSALGAGALFLASSVLLAKPFNGFDLSGATIPQKEIFQGGPPKDGIPSIDNPDFITADKVTGLQDTDLVLGISINGIARAYPIPIMNWHEIVNDQFGEKPVVVTFCPLCGSGMAFESTMDGRKLTFGVSGLLYNSDVLLYDRQTESLWSQIKSSAVSGYYKNKRLKPVPMQHTAWAHWRKQYPNTMVLSDNTGYARDYGRDPYAGYDKTKTTYFPVSFRAKGFHPKERVIGLVVNGMARAWPFVELRKTIDATGNGKTIKDKIGEKPVLIQFDNRHNSARVFDEHGNELTSVTLFWFAWAAFHADTEVYRYVPEKPGL